MNRYEAYCLNDWETRGNTFILAARMRSTGKVEIAGLMLDLWCLGVKDVLFVPDASEEEFRDMIKNRMPAEFREAIHPARALKLIEGAVDYAQSLGFAPHRDYKKARRVFNGIEGTTCDETFTYGKDGKPCFYATEEDSEERAERVLAILKAKCGPDGFHYVVPGEMPEEFEDEDGALSEEELDELERRDDLIDWFDDHADDVVDFYTFSGMLTALQLSPQPLSPLKALESLWIEPGARWKDKAEAEVFLQMVMLYWNHLSELITSALEPGATVDDAPLDIYPEDFDELNPESLGAAFFPWSMGFYETAKVWSKEQGDLLEKRADLAPHWHIICFWRDMAEKTAANDPLTPELEAMANQPNTKLHDAVFALTRALRQPPTKT